MSILKRRKKKAKAETFLVDKELAPEFRTILANVKSLISQLEMMAEGGRQQDVEIEAPGAETLASVARSKVTVKAAGGKMDDQIRMKIMGGEKLSPEERLSVLDALPGENADIEVEPPELPELPGEDEEELAALALAKDESTASDPAEARLEDLEGTTDEAVQEVGESVLAKAILSLAGKKAPVKKAAPQTDVAKALEPIAKAVAANSQAIQNMLEALGYAQDAVKKASTEQAKPKTPVQKSSGLSGSDVGEVVREVMKAFGPQKATPEEEGTGLVESFQVRKSNGGENREDLKKAMTNLFAGNAQSGRY